MAQLSDAPRLPGDASPYWLHYALDIRQFFKQLLKRGERVRLWYGEHDTDSIVSVILALSDNGTVTMDVSADTVVNQRMQDAHTVIMHGFLDGIELYCTLGPIQLTEHDGLPAFATSLPKRLHRLQRREFHRVHIPVGLTVRCEITSRGSGSASPVVRRTVPLLDISLGGLAFDNPYDGWLSLSAGLILPDCRIQLDDMGVVQADLEVRYLGDILARSGHHRHKAGCLFKRLSGGAEHTIQRFINRVDLDLKTPGPD